VAWLSTRRTHQETLQDRLAKFNPSKSSTKSTSTSFLQQIRNYYKSDRVREYNNRSYNRSSWTPETLIYSIIALNSVIFLAWQYAKYRYSAKRDSSVMDYMAKNFLSGIRSMAQGHYWTLLTSAFSHSDLIRNFPFFWNICSAVSAY
jgi:membrane associated rhomboid family serine protease